MTTSKNSSSNIRKTCNCHPNRQCHHRERQQRRLYNNNMNNRRISFFSSVKSIHIMIVIVFILLNIINNVNGQQYGGDNNNDNDGYYYGDNNNDNASPNDYYPPNNDGGVGSSDTLYQDYYAKGGNDPYATGNINDIMMGNDGNKVVNNNWFMNTMGTAFVGGIGGWIVGSKYHCRKLEKKLFNKHKADQKILYQQYYNDVYALQKQNSELIDALEQYIMVSNTGGSGSSSQKQLPNKNTGTKR